MPVLNRWSVPETVELAFPVQGQCVELGTPDLGTTVASLAWLACLSACRTAGNGRPLASTGISLLLALEKPSPRLSESQFRDSSLDPPNVSGQPLVRRTEN